MGYATHKNFIYFHNSGNIYTMNDNIVNEQSVLCHLANELGVDAITTQNGSVSWIAEYYYAKTRRAAVHYDVFIRKGLLHIDGRSRLAIYELSNPNLISRLHNKINLDLLYERSDELSKINDYREYRAVLSEIHHRRRGE